MASTLVAHGIGLVVTKELFIDVGAYSAYIAGFFLIATAIYNNEGIDGFQRDQFHSVVNRVRRGRNLPELDHVGAPL
jgi:hypothetical protein